jgi:glycosyltransferase involved in cell wall biosynthesis
MPVYFKDNQAHFAVALQSVLNQTCQPNEIVLVKDGPLSEDFDQLIEDFEKSSTVPFNIIQLPKNLGMGPAMNIGLQACKYPWVARMDSDDICRLDRFERQINTLKTHNHLDALGGYIHEFFHSPTEQGRLRKTPIKHADIVKTMRYRSPFNHMAIFYRADVAKKAGGYWDRKNYEDCNLWYEMYKSGAKFANIPEVLVDVRVTTMIGRRSGYQYFKDEQALYIKMLRDGFSSYFQYLKAIVPRYFLRRAPKWVISLIYKFTRK